MTHDEQDYHPESRGRPWTPRTGSTDALHAPEGDVDGPRYPSDEPTAVESVETLGELDVETTVTQHGGVVDHGAGAIEDVDPEAGE